MSDGLWWADDSLKTRLTHDPAAVLAEQGINVPADFPPDHAREVARIVGVVWQDGKLIPRTAFRIDPQDEGLLFGNGVWESTRTVNSLPWLWPYHIDRLRHTAAALGIAVAPERLPTSQVVGEFVRALTTTDVVIRLNVSAGRRGGVGSVWMTAWPQHRPLAGVRLQTRRSPVEKNQPYLLWKTFQYATRLRVNREAAAAGFDSALLLDEFDNILEASHANIFLRLPDGWVTPVADGGLLPGTVRQMLLASGPLKIKEAVVPWAALRDVSEAFVTNSSLGAVPVTQIDDQKLAPGPGTQALFDWLYPPTPGGERTRFVVG
jgi:branched-subunit amino acid aminotransferase/4-amino-4-deoxychorismate lyase